MKRKLIFVLAVILAAVAVRAQQSSPPNSSKPIGLAALHVPDGFTVELAASPDLAAFCMCAALDDRGRLFLCQSSGKNISGLAMAKTPECNILLLEDKNGDGVFDRAKVFADKLSLPMGVAWFRGSLYVAAAPDFLRFDDTKNKGVANHREVLASGWNIFNTASLHGPFVGPDGWLYLTHGRHGYKIKTKEGETLQGLASRIWRCKPDGSHLERVCGGGFDNPVEIIFTPAGEMLGTMTYFTDPQNGQRDALMHWMEGGVYQKNYPILNEFKQTGELMPPMTKFARIAPAGLVQYRGTNFGAEFSGNLFSAQFNPHRVQRHKLFRDGATFRTEDEDFLTSTDPDFHPCDVLEDADGSLLVVDTGGWYVDACPVSRVSRPDARGSVYRIRKIGAPKIKDPRGLKLKLEKKSPDALAKFLEDPRFVVRERAQDLLAQAGEKSIKPLAEILGKSNSFETRCAAISALGQINSAPASEKIHGALHDLDLNVRIAAARACGMTHDTNAVDDLIGLLQSNEPPVRREAATALGKIGESRAAPALLAAAKKSEDRFGEHAIIFALIQLKNSAAAIEALQDLNPKVRKAALIALDQMDGAPLQREHLAPIFTQFNDELRNAALWVASHHPDWSGDALQFVRERLLKMDFSPSDANSIRPVLLAFIANADTQAFITSLLKSPGLESERLGFLLEVVNQCSLPTFPPAWIQALGAQLENFNEKIRWQTINLLRSRGIAELDPALEKIASDEKQSADLRVAALGAFMSRHPQIAAAEFNFILSQLKPETPASLRLAAAQVLGKAELTGEQLLQLGNGQLAGADALILPALLNAFRKSTDAAAGNSLVAALLKSSVSLNQLAGGKLDDLLKNFPAEVHDAAKPLLDRIAAEQKIRLRRLDELEPLLTGGDVGRGRRIFFGQKAACFGCHAIGTEGGRLGPDLTSIGSIRSGRDLIEAIVFPSASFVPGYEPYRIETANDIYTGVIGNQTPEAVVLKTGANAEARIPREQIKSMVPGTVSIMPEGLDVALSREEMLDLLAFLQAQNGDAYLQALKPGEAKHLH